METSTYLITFPDFPNLQAFLKRLLDFESTHQNIDPDLDSKSPTVK